MSKNKDNKGKITIANWLAIIGLAALGVVTFFGYAYESTDGKLGSAIIMAVVTTGILGFLLGTAIKVKQAESHVEMWRWVEYASIAIYIVVALIFCDGFHKYFYVNSEKDNLQGAALCEISEIENMYEEYNEMVETSAAKAVEQLKNYVTSRSESSEIDDYMSQRYIDRTDESIDNWRKLVVEDLCKVEPDSSLELSKNSIQAWRPLEIAQAAVDLEEAGKKVADRLNNKVKDNINNGLIPKFEYRDGEYIYDGLVEKEFVLSNDENSPSEGNFKTKLIKAKGYTVGGWILYIILNCLILLNYVATRRSAHVRPQYKKTTGGNGQKL